MPYCSSECFKSHGVACTEAFFRKHVEDEMVVRARESGTKLTASLGSATLDDKILRKRVLDMVKRTAQSDADVAMQFNSDIDEFSSQGNSSNLDIEKLQELSEMEKIDLHDLTPELQKRFLRAVADGQVSGEIEKWKPWWIELKDVSAESHNHPASRPTILSLDSPLERPMNDSSPGLHGYSRGSGRKKDNAQSRIKSSAAPTLKYNLVCILYSYVETWRHYNGEAISLEPLEAAQELLHASAVLSGDQRYTCTEEAVMQSVEMWTQRQSISKSHHSDTRLCDSIGHRVINAADQDEILLMDVCDIVCGGSCCILEALTEIRLLFEAAMQEMSELNRDGINSYKGKGVEAVDMEASPKKRQKEAKRRLRLVIKKIEFFIAWSGQQEFQVFSTLHNELQRELKNLQERKRLCEKADTARSEAKNRDALIVNGAMKPIMRNEESSAKFASRKAKTLIEEV